MNRKPVIKQIFYNIGPAKITRGPGVDQNINNVTRFYR